MKDNVNSPLSLKPSCRLIETYETSKLKEDWLNFLGIDISDEMKGTDKIFLYRCEESQLDFFLPESAAGSQSVYSGLQKFDWFYMPEKWEFEEALRDLKECNSLLEIGCGQGFFIEKVLKSLKCRAVKGIEFSEGAVKKAIAKKLPVEKASLQDLINRKESFDSICCFQVLEHISSPRPFIKDALQLLKPGGDFILCVPNKESFLKYQYNLLDMPPHHMTRWSSRTFKYLERIFPLKLVNESYEPLAKYHIEGYVQAHGNNLRKKLPIPLSALTMFSNMLSMSGLYRFCLGQSLYVRYKKI